MKKSTKKISSLFVAAVMAISVMPTASFSADAADVPAFQFELRTNAAPGSRLDTVEISRDQLASGDYTFSVGGYIISEEFPSDAYITSAYMAWEPITADGNSAYRYISFSNVLDKVNKITSQDVTLPDGSTISALYNPHSMSIVSERKGGIIASNWNQTLADVLMDQIDGNPIYPDGKGGCYFVNADKGNELVICEVETHEDGSATLKYPYTEKSEGTLLTMTHEVVYYDAEAPGVDPSEFGNDGPTFAANLEADPNYATPLSGTNNIDYALYTGGDVVTFLGGSSDAFATTTFDVTIDQDTPDGTYYIAFDDQMQNQICCSDWSSHDPSNIEVVYGDYGVVLGYTRNDQANWLKIVVGDGSTPTTTTTTSSTTTTTSQSTTTTTTTSGGDVSYDSYTWEAGEYWVEPGADFAITPKVYECPGNLVAINWDLDSNALDNGAIISTGEGYMGEAYTEFSDMMFNLDEIHAGGSAITGCEAAADGATFGEL